jgi:myosin heavy subunit
MKVKHSQCDVEYNLNGFKMKNMDKVSEDIIGIINKLKIG